jgi:hypothetical protein
MSVKLKAVDASVVIVAIGGMLLAAPKPPPGKTPPPSKCKPVGYHAMLDAVGTIKPHNPLSVPTGNCSQIKITAWRNEYDYTCGDPLTPHESTTAVGRSLKECSYKLPVEEGHMVSIRATTTIKGWCVVLTYKDSSETSPAIWEEKHPVTINWLLKPCLTVKPHKAK